MAASKVLITFLIVCNISFLIAAPWNCDFSEGDCGFDLANWQIDNQGGESFAKTSVSGAELTFPDISRTGATPICLSIDYSFNLSNNNCLNIISGERVVYSECSEHDNLIESEIELNSDIDYQANERLMLTVSTSEASELWQAQIFSISTSDGPCLEVTTLADDVWNDDDEFDDDLDIPTPNPDDIEDNQNNREVNYSCHGTEETVPVFRRCDGVRDCRWGDDEDPHYCRSTFCTEEGIHCITNTRNTVLDRKVVCVNMNSFCDGIRDCVNGVDEDPRLCDGRACGNNYCLNGGECRNVHGKLNGCQCTELFSAKRCQTVISNLANNQVNAEVGRRGNSIWDGTVAVSAVATNLNNTNRELKLQFSNEGFAPVLIALIVVVCLILAVALVYGATHCFQKRNHAPVVQPQGQVDNNVN